jgi:hypothetical protein
MLVKNERIIRHAPPGPLDQLPKDTICEVHLPQDKIEYYKQTSEDSSNPVWNLNGWHTEI